MPPNKGDAAFLWDMLDAACAVRSFVSGKSFHEYLGNRMLRGAVERHIEIIGEAARGLSEEIRAANPGIPWAKIVAQRHVLAHEYGEIDHDLIWRVATVHIPELIAALEHMVPPAPGSSS